MIELTQLVIDISSQRCFSRPNSMKYIRYAFKTKPSWRVEISIIGFKVKDLFSMNKQTTIITIIMETQAKF